MNANHLIATAGLALALTTGASKAAPVVFNFTGGFQSFTAPTTGIYDITAIGAQGGAGFQGGTGGLGAKVAGDFMLTQGEMLSILVGGRGQDGLGAGGFDSGGGGGGGSYVLGPGSQQVTFNPTSGVYTTNQYNFAALAIAGGGGGGAPDGGSNGIAGQAGREGTDNLSNPSAAPAGYGGNSGDGSTAGGGGAGLFTRGDGGDGGGGNPPFLPPPSSSAIHIASIPLGEGGGGTGLGGDGGFGGGGGGTQGVGGVDGGGGGGGYIGGDGGGVPGAQGGGAGSFLADGTPVNRDFVDLSGVNSGDGLVTIDFVPTMTSGVPEPSTWAMMLLGFGGLGFLGYRKSRKGDAVAMLAA